MSAKPSESGASAPDSRALFDLLLAGKSVTETVATPRGDFSIKYPAGRDKLRMDQLRAFRRNGLPASAFDVEALFNNDKWSTLDVCVVDGPDWLRAAKAANPNWTWEDCPDEELTSQLYARIESFRKRISGEITASRPSRAAEGSQRLDMAAPLGDGAFSGLAFGSQDSGTR